MQSNRDDFLKSLYLNVGADSAFLTKEIINKLDPTDIVALYLAYIGVSSIRKILAPHLLAALNVCTPQQIAGIVESTRPLTADTYQILEKLATTSASIEVYICYAFVTADIKKLKIGELNAVITYLRNHHPDKKRIIGTLSAILQALTYESNLNFSLTDICFPNGCYLNLSGAHLRWARFTSKLNYARFESAALDYSQFTTPIVYVSFGNASLIHTEFNAAWFKNTDISGAKLIGTQFNVIHFDEMQFQMIRGYGFLFDTFIEMNRLETDEEFHTRLRELAIERIGPLIVDASTLASGVIKNLIDKGWLSWEKIFILLPDSLITEKQLTSALNKYEELEKLFSEDQVTTIRELLVNAVLKKMIWLADLSLEIESVFNTALNHPCFKHRDKIKGFFNLEYTSSQKKLIAGYEQILQNKKSTGKEQTPAKK